MIYPIPIAFQGPTGQYAYLQLYLLTQSNLKLKFWIHVPSSIYATRKGLFTAIAPGASLHVDPTETRHGPNGDYIAIMDVVSRTSHREERIALKSNPKRSVLATKENLAIQALKAYFGDRAISALDYTFRCVIFAQ
jgi:hypothetical protein